MSNAWQAPRGAASIAMSIHARHSASSAARTVLSSAVLPRLILSLRLIPTGCPSGVSGRLAFLSRPLNDPSALPAARRTRLASPPSVVAKRVNEMALTVFGRGSILNHMVKYQDDSAGPHLCRARRSHPARAAGAARQARRAFPSASWRSRLRCRCPPIMKHLDVLSDAGLIAREKTGRTVACRLTAKPMEQAMDWLNRYAALLVRQSRPPCRFCGGRPMADRISAPPTLAVATTEPHLHAPPQCQRRPKSTPRGPTRKNSPLVRPRRRSSPRPCGRRSMRASAATTASASIPTSEYYEVGGIYREVVPNERLVFSWAWHSTPERESLVTVTLEARRRRHAAHAAPRAIVRRGRARGPRAADGWASLDKLEKFVA